MSVILIKQILTLTMVKQCCIALWSCILKMLNQPLNIYGCQLKPTGTKYLSKLFSIIPRQ